MHIKLANISVLSHVSMLRHFLRLIQSMRVYLRTGIAVLLSGLNSWINSCRLSLHYVEDCRSDFIQEASSATAKRSQMLECFGTGTSV